MLADQALVIAILTWLSGAARLAVTGFSGSELSGAVLLLVEHGAQRSLTLAINRPSRVTAGELLASLNMTWRGRESDVVWSGGPVASHNGWVLHDAPAMPPITGVIPKAIMRRR